jgi:hypothetical protein
MSMLLLLLVDPIEQNGGFARARSKVAAGEGA